ncbi:DUF5320 domain-containing protein [Myxococcota bacterium]
MPGGDKTGPLGDGPMTGRAAGICNDDPMPSQANPAFGGGRGFGRGRGGGRRMGWRHGRRGRGSRGYAGSIESNWGPGPIPQAPSREAELAMLRDQASQMEGAVEEIRRRITELETVKDEK